MVWVKDDSRLDFKLWITAIKDYIVPLVVLPGRTNKVACKIITPFPHIAFWFYASKYAHISTQLCCEAM